LARAANRVSKAFQEDHPDIPWRRIIAQRHVLIHEYGEIKQELIWKVAIFHIPQLISGLKPLVSKLPDRGA